MQQYLSMRRATVFRCRLNEGELGGDSGASVAILQGFKEIRAKLVLEATKPTSGVVEVRSVVLQP
jgi:hypothetical protein